MQQLHYHCTPLCITLWYNSFSWWDWPIRIYHNEATPSLKPRLSVPDFVLFKVMRQNLEWKACVLRLSNPSHLKRSCVDHMRMFPQLYYDTTVSASCNRWYTTQVFPHSECLAQWLNCISSLLIHCIYYHLQQTYRQWFLTEHNSFVWRGSSCTCACTKRGNELSYETKWAHQKMVNQHADMFYWLHWPTWVTMQSLQTLRHNGYLSLGQPNPT